MSNAALSLNPVATVENNAEYINHLMRVPLTGGKEALIDPDEIASVSMHRHEPGVAVIRQRQDPFVYFVARSYEQVKAWVRDALHDPAEAQGPHYIGHLLCMPMTEGKEVLLDPDEIMSIAEHRRDVGVTVIRQKDDPFVYFIALPYPEVMAMVND